MRISETTGAAATSAIEDTKAPVVARPKRKRAPKGALVPVCVLSAAVLAGADTDAAEPPIAVGEVTTVADASGVDPATLRDTAEGEIRQIDVAELPNHGTRRVVVSFALTRAAVEGPVICTVNAMLRDARTGAMLAIIEAGAQAEGPGSPELRKRLAHAAVRSAVRRIPTALEATAK
jgi:hypothetical protein